jgi:Flp pilus assembly protein TadD
MKTRVISCCIAVLSFAACEDKVQPVPRPIAEVKPVAAPIAARPAFDAAESTKSDEPADTLALKHDQPAVDHLGRAQKLSADGDLSGAMTEARRAIFSMPTDEETLEFTARLAQKSGNHEIAIEAYGRLAQLRIDDAVPLVQQAREMVKAKQFDRAVIVGKRAIARDAGNPEGFQAAGLGHLGNGELQGAISMFTKVIELKPDHAWALNNLGLAYLRANENEKAIEVLSHSAELLPNTAYVHNNLGVALERVGRTEEAQQAYLTATNLSPKYVKARINAARVAKAGEGIVDEPQPVIGGDDKPDTDPEN